MGKTDEVIVTTPPITKEEDQIAQTHTDKVIDSSMGKPSATPEENQKQGSLPMKELDKNEDLAMESYAHEKTIDKPSEANALPNGKNASEETPSILPSLQDSGENHPDLETEVSLFFPGTRAPMRKETSGNLLIFFPTTPLKITACTMLTSENIMRAILKGTDTITH